jgi:hypothetical protein
MSGLPEIFTSGFGVESVIGRMRAPSPAARTIARRGMDFVSGADMHQTFSGGTLARYQAASGASAGCASERCR